MSPKIGQEAESVRLSVKARSRRQTMRRGLLACGIAGSLLYAVAHDVLAAMLYREYSPFSQTISELASIGAPTRPAVIVVVLTYEALLVAFGLGVWQSAQGKRGLRVAGALMLALGAIGPLWLPFPITARGQIATTGGFADVMHLVLGALTILFMLSIIGFGAAAFGKRFRLYSILTFATVAVFWCLTLMYAPQVAAGEATPWLGVIERIALAAWLLWLVVLAVILLRTRCALRALVNARRFEPDHDLG